MFKITAQKRPFRIISMVLLLSVVALLVSAVLVVNAYLKAQTPEVTNEFVPVVVTCQVEETFDGALKENVCIRNTGDVTAYIRATVVCNWVDDEGNVWATAPRLGTDYTIQWGSAYWVQGSDGFWYYQRAVSAGLATNYLISKAECIGTAPAGFHLQMQVLATAVQADPAMAVESAWGARVDGNTLIAP